MGKRRWWGEELARLRHDYEHTTLPVVAIARKYDTSLGQIARLVRENRFAPRRPNHKNPKLSQLRRQKRVIEATISRNSRRLRQIEAKIVFLEAVNAGNRRDEHLTWLKK